MDQDITIGEKYDPIFKIQTEAEALEYFERCVQHNLSFGESTREEAERIERANIGYYAGYGSHEDRVRVEQLFRCAHPVFGAAQSGKPVDPVDALNAGRDLAAGDQS